MKFTCWSLAAQMNERMQMMRLRENFDGRIVPYLVEIPRRCLWRRITECLHSGIPKILIPMTQLLFESPALHGGTKSVISTAFLDFWSHTARQKIKVRFFSGARQGPNESSSCSLLVLFFVLATLFSRRRSTSTGSSVTQARKTRL